MRHFKTAFSRLFRYFYGENDGIIDMYKRLLPLPKRSFFLFGPRGTGKSVWLPQVLAESPLRKRSPTVSEASSTVTRQLLSRPSEIFSMGVP